MRCLLIFILLSIIQQIYSQDSIYFNNVYQHNNNFAIGMTILETNDGYVGYGGTEDPGNIGQMLLFFKINKQGEQVIWKPFGEDYHDYYFGNVGGAMTKTYDNNFVMACHYGYGSESFGTLIKLDNNLDTVWKKDYHPAYKTITLKCIQTFDKGYAMTGWVWLSEDDYADLILLKTDSSGNYEWHQLYGNNLAEHGESIIQTSDGGYLLGGFRYDPAVYHSLNALVIKTDSLGNEEWTKTFGNPNVDDDMAHVALADDGNYLVATVYGEWIFSYETRAGKQCIYKVNQQGQTIDIYYPGGTRLINHLRNFRKTENGYIMTGFSYETDSVSYQYHSGWMMKLDNNLDSLWYRDYYYSNNESDQNLLYDMFPCQDKGYIGAGFAWPDIPGTNEKLWVIKVDSMGCDTAGCATGTFVYELPKMERQELVKVYPNPAHEYVIFQLINFLPIRRISRGQIFITNSFGQPVAQLPVSGDKTTWDCHAINPGIYFYLFQTKEKTYTGKFLIIK
jgi:hypothetical protein